QTAECVDFTGCGTDNPVDVVEGIQGLGAQFKIHAFREPDAFRQAQVKAEERWSFENQVVVSALSDVALLAIAEAGRSNKPTRRGALRIDRAGRREGRIVGSERIQANVR